MYLSFGHPGSYPLLVNPPHFSFHEHPHRVAICHICTTWYFYTLPSQDSQLWACTGTESMWTPIVVAPHRPSVVRRHCIPKLHCIKLTSVFLLSCHSRNPRPPFLNKLKALDRGEKSCNGQNPWAEPGSERAVICHLLAGLTYDCFQQESVHRLTFFSRLYFGCGGSDSFLGTPFFSGNSKRGQEVWDPTVVQSDHPLLVRTNHSRHQLVVEK